MLEPVDLIYLPPFSTKNIFLRSRRRKKSTPRFKYFTSLLKSNRKSVFLSFFSVFKNYTNLNFKITLSVKNSIADSKGMTKSYFLDRYIGTGHFFTPHSYLSFYNIYIFSQNYFNTSTLKISDFKDTLLKDSPYFTKPILYNSVKYFRNYFITKNIFRNKNINLFKGLTSAVNISFYSYTRIISSKTLRSLSHFFLFKIPNFNTRFTSHLSNLYLNNFIIYFLPSKIKKLFKTHKVSLILITAPNLRSFLVPNNIPSTPLYYPFCFFLILQKFHHILVNSVDTKIIAYNSSYNFYTLNNYKRYLLGVVYNESLFLRDSVKVNYFNNNSNRFYFLPNTLQFPQNLFKNNRSLNLLNLSKVIARVKFVPGYSTRWRKYRTELKFFLSIKLTYQQRLTKLIQRIHYVNRRFILKKTSLKILTVLTLSHFFPDIHSAKLGIQERIIFLNANPCLNENLILVYKDTLQIIINLKYYIISKWLYNFYIVKKMRALRLLNQSYNASKSSVLTNKTFKLPHYFLYFKNSFLEIPKYLEVDFFTLSLWVIYNISDSSNFLNYEYDILFYKIFNLYNWKYIT